MAGQNQNNLIDELKAALVRYSEESDLDAVAHVQYLIGKAQAARVHEYNGTAQETVRRVASKHWAEAAAFFRMNSITEDIYDRIDRLRTDCE